MVDSHETPNMYPNLSETPLNIPLNDQQHFRLNKINEIKDYFVAEIKERELMSKRLSKYIAFFDYFDKSLIVSSITTGSVSIASFVTIIGAPVGVMSASFSLIIKKTIKNNKKRRKNIIKLLCWLEVNYIAQKAKYLKL